MRKIFTKYLILLSVYFIISRLLHSFAFKLYYNIFNNPEMTSNAVNQIQMIILGISNLYGLAIAIIMMVDLKRKKLLEWIIILITIFYPSIGIAFFLLLRLSQIYEAQQHLSNMAK